MELDLGLYTNWPRDMVLRKLGLLLPEYIYVYRLLFEENRQVKTYSILDIYP